MTSLVDRFTSFAPHTNLSIVAQPQTYVHFRSWNLMLAIEDETEPFQGNVQPKKKQSPIIFVIA